MFFGSSCTTLRFYPQMCTKSRLFPYYLRYSLFLCYILMESCRGRGMRQFNYSLIKDQKWDSDLLGLIAAIYREAGKQEMYLKQRSQELEKLVEIAKIQSTEASNAIEGIVTTSTRIRQLVERYRIILVQHILTDIQKHYLHLLLLMKHRRRWIVSAKSIIASSEIWNWSR